ncbi:MAG: glycosyltransferase family 4 protein [Oscillospiraceae bacterium]|nr:glycosyltransferase family 4 protein [Oscillospiraceae bacterium]
MGKKRVLMVHNFYQIGGGEHTVFENEKNLLIENGHEVYTYTRSNDELKQSKLKMLMLPFSTIWSTKTYREVRRLIREKHIDIVHCHNTFPLISPSVYYAARSLKVPVVQTIHNFRFLCPNGLLYSDGKICEKCRETGSFAPALKNGCYRGSKIQTAVVVAMLKIHRWLGTYRKINYIFLTEFNKEKFEGLLHTDGENVFLKPNFVKKAPEIETAKEIKPKFIYAGRLDENKGIRFLLGVWPTLPDEYELHIYGDGTYRENCEQAAKDNKNIRYFGFRPQECIFTDLSDAAALVFPSEWYEGYPMILAESFAAGRPVVCTSMGNHGDLVETSCGGMTFDLMDQKNFHKALETVIRDNKVFSDAASAYYRKTLTPEVNYEMLSDIYEQAKHIQ